MSERSKGKRPLLEDSDDASMEKKPKFPKGKKAKGEGGAHIADEEGLDALVDAQLAAKERAKRRNQMREDELFKDQQADVLAAEVYYDENAILEDDGIQIEPFNLKQEREEGYFDANGNYVEYVGQNEIKDAWLDSAVVDPSFVQKIQKKTVADEEYQELSSEDIGKIKRSIANVLQPGETIIQALKRIKGTSGDKKEKMSEGTKRTFDQLTEDAMKLLENGEYNVYHEEQEIFEQEAEGYERIARARKGIFATAEISSNGTENGAGSTSIWDRSLGKSEANTSLQGSSIDAGDQFDIFGDDEDNTKVNVSEHCPQPASESMEHSQEAGTGTESDFVYDQSSGYYYSGSLGYYYDPASKLYCCATSGIWYSFDEQTGEYVECQNVDAATAQT